MWGDQIRERYWWLSMQNEIEELFYQLSKAEDEEEVGVYLLRLHFENEQDLRFFSAKERKKVKELLSNLIDDTIRHKDMLFELTEEIKSIQKDEVGLRHKERRR